MTNNCQCGCYLFVVLCALIETTIEQGRTIHIDWTPEGVALYRSYSNPLRMELSDQLQLSCGENVSNLFIQDDQIQYDTCNASAGSGRFNFNGFCFAQDIIELTLTENSQDLTNTINFVNNKVYYLSSYYNSSVPSSANDPTMHSGGQCELGVKMIIIIGEVPLLPNGSLPTQNGSLPNTGGVQPPDTGGVQPSGKTGGAHGSSGMSMWVYVGASAAGFVVILVITVVVIAAVCIRVRRKRSSSTTLNDISRFSHPSSDDLLDTRKGDLYSTLPSQHGKSDPFQTEIGKEDLSVHNDHDKRVKDKLNYTDVTVQTFVEQHNHNKAPSRAQSIPSHLNDDPVQYSTIAAKSADDLLSAPGPAYSRNASTDHLLNSTLRKPKPPLPPPKSKGIHQVL